MREARREEEKAGRQRAVFIHRKKGSSRGATGEGRTVNFDMTRVSVIGWDFVLHKTGLIIPDPHPPPPADPISELASIEH